MSYLDVKGICAGIKKISKKREVYSMCVQTLKLYMNWDEYVVLMLSVRCVRCVCSHCVAVISVVFMLYHCCLFLVLFHLWIVCCLAFRCCCVEMCLLRCCVAVLLLVCSPNPGYTDWGAWSSSVGTRSSSCPSKTDNRKWLKETERAARHRGRGLGVGRRSQLYRRPRK